MVVSLQRIAVASTTLSVLALSSRFDGPGHLMCLTNQIHLSVLALSSRFDGRKSPEAQDRYDDLSVLALSSRFDGQLACLRLMLFRFSFSTRSVESF